MKFDRREMLKVIFSVSHQDPEILTSSIDVSIDSHIMTSKAEESIFNKETLKL